MSDERTCQYIADGEGASGHTDAEVIHDNGVVTCEAEADMVIRRKVPLKSSDGRMNADKTPVCAAHGRYLRSDDVPIAWEACESLIGGNDG